MEKGTKLEIGVFVTLAVLLGGAAFFIAPEDVSNAFFCESNEVVGLCFKLSAINDAGLSTRCYYNESSPTKYKTCSSGWKEYNETEFVAEPINLLEEEEVKPKIIPIHKKVYSSKEQALTAKQEYTMPVLEKIMITETHETLTTKTVEYCLYLMDSAGAEFTKCNTWELETPYPTDEEVITEVNIRGQEWYAELFTTPTIARIINPVDSLIGTKVYP